MKLLTICLTFLLLLSCSAPDNAGRIESLKVLESCALSRCAEGDEKLGEILDFVADKTQPDRLNDRVNQLCNNMKSADSLSSTLISELNLRRRKLINQKPSKSNWPNKPIELEYSEENKLNESATPSKKHIKELIQEIETYRNELCKKLIESQQISPSREPYYFSPPKVLIFKNDEEKAKAISTAIKRSRIAEEDIDGVIRIMELLTEKKSTWEAMLSSDQDWIDLSMGLLSIQEKILAARNIAFRYIIMRVGCRVGFNITKFTPIVLGSNNAIPNDTVNFEVLVVGYNEYFDHEVTVSEGARFLRYENGKALFEAVLPGSGELKLNGEISIQRKSGYSKPRKWSHTIKVLEPQ